MKKTILTLAAACLFPFAASSALAQATPAEQGGVAEPARVPAAGIKKHANKKHAVAKPQAKKAAKKAAKKHGKKH